MLDLPMKRYNGSDYDKFENIRRVGFRKMKQAIEAFQKQQPA